jgi:translation initiation factor 1 (eIF-1/SUI1)
VLGSELALSQELSEANFVVERIREDTIVLKGHVVEQVKQFLKEKGF